MTQKETSYSQWRCSVCGAELPPVTLPNICPKCLLKIGLSTQSEAVKSITATVQRQDRQQFDVKFQPGDKFGHYQIERLLGQGGMGAVYAAEDLESGRRVALKIMSHKLDSPEARARFLREGRLAAALNHPNSVYIYGTEEIAGMPIITMELVSGGTLQERVRQAGPLPVNEAVDCVLQVIDGLEAAQNVGILHRDIKPSNCFVDNYGAIKIGDFGLSVSTAIRLEPLLTNTGAFLGTPAFSSPEQLRGDELTVRSDIYAVGVTLYYLLTGAVPFESPKLPQLIALVLERRPESPAKLRRNIPAGLCRIVMRCLEKNPEQRFKNYADLRKALLAYSSTATTPAPLRKRFFAGVIDALILGELFTLITLPFVLRFQDRSQYLQLLTLMIISLPYYALLEGIWGASLGKFLCGLRVMKIDRTSPGIRFAFYRAAIFILLPYLLNTLIYLLGGKFDSSKLSELPLWVAAIMLVFSLMIQFLPFITARRRNAFAGLHDLATGTRVVQIKKAVYAARQTQPYVETMSASNTEGMAKIGPYHVLETLAANGIHEFLLGYDDRLLRKVWISKSAPANPSVSLALRSLGRPGRLRWLNGRRSTTENWDAWEALAGQPLLRLIREKQCWSRVRFWILDLAEELQAAQADNTMPATISLEQIWITDDGHAKLLDFPAPGIENTRTPQGGQSEGGIPTPQEFMRQVAVSAIEGRLVSLDESKYKLITVPLALHAREFLDSLPKTAVLKEALECLKPLLNKPAIVTRARRLALVLGYLAWPVFTLISTSLLLVLFSPKTGMEKISTGPMLSTMLLIGGLSSCLFWIFVVAIFSLITALVSRGGLLMHLAGVTVVNRDGTPASRWRVLWRNLIAVLPLMIILITTLIGLFVVTPASLAASSLWSLMGLSMGFLFIVLIAPGALVVLQSILTVVSLVLPDRSLQDRLAGTWLVPK